MFKRKIYDKYIAYTKDLSKDNDILYLPVYMTFLL